MHSIVCFTKNAADTAVIVLLTMSVYVPSSSGLSKLGPEGPLSGRV